MANLSDMSFLQAVVFWAMLGKMLLFFVEIERRRGKPEPVVLVDGFTAINRRQMEMVMKQL